MTTTAHQSYILLNPRSPVQYTNMASNQFYASQSPRVGRSKNAYDIFVNKPGVGPIDFSLDSKEFSPASTMRRSGRSGQSPFKNAGAQISSPRRQEVPVGIHTSPIKRQLQRRAELNTDVSYKPFVGEVPNGLDTAPPEAIERANATQMRCSERYSPGTDSVRKAHVNARHPSGRAYQNIGKVAVSPNKIGENIGYKPHLNSSHNHDMTTYIARRNDGGRYFEGSSISHDPVLNSKESDHPSPHHDVAPIGVRNEQSLHRKRNVWGAPFHNTTLQRELAMHNRLGHLKKADGIPQELIDATNAALLDDATADDLANMPTGSMGTSYEAKTKYDDFRGRTPEFNKKFSSKNWGSEYAASSVVARNKLSQSKQVELMANENDVLRRSNRMLRERMESGIRLDMFDSNGNYTRKV